jgi:hypothetical protein
MGASWKAALRLEKKRTKEKRSKAWSTLIRQMYLMNMKAERG